MEGNALNNQPFDIALRGQPFFVSFFGDFVRGPLSPCNERSSALAAIPARKQNRARTHKVPARFVSVAVYWQATNASASDTVMVNGPVPVRAVAADFTSIGVQVSVVPSIT